MKTEMQEALRVALTPPDYYYGELLYLPRKGWARVWSIHRDSSVLEESNWAYVLNRLRENFSEDDYRISHSTHWAVGWMDTLVVKALKCKCEDDEDAYITYTGNDEWYCQVCGEVATVQPIFEEIFDLHNRVADYPILDEEDFYQRELEELMEYLEGEVGEKAEELASYLFETFNVSAVEDIPYGAIEEWKNDVYMSEESEEA